MKLGNKIRSTLALTLSLLALSCAHANLGSNEENTSTNLTIEFVEPKSFTDVLPSNESRSKFRKRVMAEFEEYFTEFADDLPQGQSLEVSVTDIDLAGDTRSPRIPIGSAFFDVRVMEDIFIPRIDFSYVLKDASGMVLQSDEVKLKDMAYLQRAGVLRGNRHAFSYERNMIERWFKDTFERESKTAS